MLAMNPCTCRCTFVSLLVVVFASFTVQAWDLGVVTRAQVQFLARQDHSISESNLTLKDNHVVENTAADQLKDMVAVAYDPVGKNVYVSDSNAKAGSIFRIRTTGNAAYSTIEPVVTKQTSTVQGMAFDERTFRLYWTTGSGHTINYLHVAENDTKIPQTGHVLISFKQEIPQGIAIDSCRGFLYWTNTNHLNASIGRSRLDGTDQRVIVSENLFLPLGVAVDVEQNLVYWSNEREGMYYSIECSDPDGGSRRTVNHGTHHTPFSIALDDRFVYWSDWTSNVVWSWPKNGGSTPDGRASLVAKYEAIFAPMGLVTRSGTTSLVNDTECAMNRAKEVAAAKAELPAMMVSYDALRYICKNGGVLHATNGTCECATGYVGGNCEASVCDGYCVTGTCVVDERTGRPRCQCPESSAIHGERCEKELCQERCQNGGECVLDGAAENPRCRCLAGYSGDACQVKSSLLADLCDVYCEHTAPESRRSAFCRCEGFDNRHVESIYSDMPSCKLNKTMIGAFFLLMLLIALLGTVTMVLTRKVRLLGRRPRIKKRIVVNKSITPLTSCRPPQQQNQQCEITIENCCNMNICETPCFEQDFRPQKLGGLMPSMGKSKKEDKANLLSNTDMTSSEDEKPVY